MTTTSEKKKEKIINEKDKLTQLLEEAKKSVKVERQDLEKEKESIFGLFSRFSMAFEEALFGGSSFANTSKAKISPYKNLNSEKIRPRENQKEQSTKTKFNPTRSYQSKEFFKDKAKFNSATEKASNVNKLNKRPNSKIEIKNNPEIKKVNLQADALKLNTQAENVPLESNADFKNWLKQDFFFKQKLFKLLDKNLNEIKNILKNLRLNAGPDLPFSFRGGFPGAGGRNQKRYTNTQNAKNKDAKTKGKTTTATKGGSFARKGKVALGGFFLGDLIGSSSNDLLEEKEQKRKELNKPKESFFGAEKGEGGFLNSRALGYAGTIGGEALKYAAIGQFLGPQAAVIAGVVGGIVGLTKALAADGTALKEALNSFIAAIKSIWEFIKNITLKITDTVSTAISTISESPVGKVFGKVTDFFTSNDKKADMKPVVDNIKVKEASIQPVKESKVTTVRDAEKLIKPAVITVPAPAPVGNNKTSASTSSNSAEKNQTVIASTTNYGNQSVFDHLDIIHRDGGIDTINLIR